MLFLNHDSEEVYKNWAYFCSSFKFVSLHWCSRTTINGNRKIKSKKSNLYYTCL